MFSGTTDTRNSENDVSTLKFEQNGNPVVSFCAHSPLESVLLPKAFVYNDKHDTHFG